LARRANRGLGPADDWLAGRTAGSRRRMVRTTARRPELRCVGHRSPCHNRPQRPAVLGRAQSEGTEIDIIFLVERLESIIANGKKLPLTNNVVIDQTSALGLIDELRVAVPEEVRAAKRINSEGERIIEKAQEESERIVARAQEQAAFLIDERGLTQQAEADSRRIIAEAEQDAEEVRRGADEYAVNVLVGLEGEVVKTLQSIKKGIDLLDARRTDLRADEQNGTEEPENGWAPEADYDDEEAELPVRR
jgi:F0F1-type ATP synthase membrane subunit b/b'